MGDRDTKRPVRDTTERPGKGDSELWARTTESPDEGAQRDRGKENRET